MAGYAMPVSGPDVRWLTLTEAQAAALSTNYRLSLITHVAGLTVFLLVNA